MTAEQFCYWLQGFLEMGDPSEMNETQTRMLKEHLGLVFVKVTSVPVVPTKEAVKKEILTDTIQDKVRQDIITGIHRKDHWDPMRVTTWCSPGFTDRGVKIC